MTISASNLIDRKLTTSYDGNHTATKTYEVFGGKTETLESVRDYTGGPDVIPAIGDQFESSGCLCVSKDAYQTEDLTKYIVTCNYQRVIKNLAQLGSISGSGGGSGSGSPADYEQDPISRPRKVSGGSVKIQLPVTSDNNGKPIKNIVGDLYTDISLQRSYAIQKLVIVKNMANSSFDISGLTALTSKKNNATFLGYSAGQVLFDDFTFEIKYEGSYSYTEVTYIFLVDVVYEHQYRLIQKGKRWYNPVTDKLVPFPNNAIGLLNADGEPLATGADAVYQYIDYIYEADFSSIVI